MKSTCLRLLEPLWRLVVYNVLELKPGQAHDVVGDLVEEPVKVPEVSGGAGADGVEDGDLSSGHPEPKLVLFLKSKLFTATVDQLSIKFLKTQRGIILEEGQPMF